MDTATRDLERVYEQVWGAKPLAIYPSPSPEHDACMLAGVIQSVLAKFSMTLLDDDYNLVATLKVVGYSEGKLIGILDESAERTGHAVAYVCTNGTILRETGATVLGFGTTLRVEQPIGIK
jgi:hypothetical protein